jgi:mono/diheme cytochrome c family protein
MKATTAVVLLGCTAMFFQLSCGQKPGPAKTDPLLNAYGTQRDWNDPTRLIPLDYEQAQGKRVFYDYCVWCHADSTPAGPSNRSNLTPTPALINDGKAMNPLSDTYLQNMIALGGSAVGKSAMMPPWGNTLSPGDLRALIRYTRAVARPPYQAPAKP